MKEYHILSLSGGKDSTALAFFMKENMPDIFKKTELVFCDTEHELPEIYDYLNKVEVFLGKPITRIKPYVSFDQIHSIYGFLPHPACRWCTVEMKTKPFRKHIYDKFNAQGEGCVYLYIGIRADEAHRVKTATSTDNYINERFPFVDNNIGRSDVIKMLEDVGVGLPEFYNWKTRSGCYFCFYQSKKDWINLREQHPDLFKKAMGYEFYGCEKIKKGSFSWIQNLPLKELIKPENIEKIKMNYEKKQERLKNKKTPEKLINMYGAYLVDEDEECENTCLFCHL